MANWARPQMERTMTNSTGRAITRRAALKLGVAGAATLAAIGPASALVKITVSGGNFTPLPIAIPDFDSADPQFGRDVADVVRNDLTRSGLFAVVDAVSLPVQVGDVNAQPDFAAWRATKAAALVMGHVERGAAVTGAVRVWDTEQSAQVVGKSYTTDAQSWRRIGHIIADAIYTALAGAGGYFDTRIAFVSETGPRANRVKRLAIMDQDGANVQYLTQGDSLVVTPRFSPDRRYITYLNYDNGQPQVYVLQLATGRITRLGNFGPMTFAPRFSPDGGSIAFSVESGGATNLYSVSLEGGQPLQLTSGAQIDTGPSYSPDGRQIVFESDRGGDQQLYLMGARGGPAQRISYGQGTYSTPAWSPLGDLIAFTRKSGGQFQIGTMKTDGSDERILVSTYHAEGPTWAPNGRVLMYFSDPGGDSGPSLYTVDIWGRTNLKVPTETFASDPNWSTLMG